MPSIAAFYSKAPVGMMSESKMPRKVVKYLKAERVFFAEYLKKNPGAVVLDVGAGPGNSSFVASPFASKVIAVDFSRPLLNKLKENTKNLRKEAKNIELIEADAESLPLRKNIINIVICTYHTLGNMKDPVKVLCEMKRVVNKGGAILLSLYSEKFTTNERLRFYASCGLTIKSITDGVIQTGEGFFSRLLPLREITEMLRAAGFKEFKVHRLAEIGRIIEARK